jgi:hypothetical protein
MIGEQKPKRAWRPRLTRTQVGEIIARAIAKNDNRWRETYRNIAGDFGIHHVRVTQIVRSAGVPPRLGGCGGARPRPAAARARAIPPPGLETLFDVLKKKVGRSEALRLVREHQQIRGLAA